LGSERRKATIELNRILALLVDDAQALADRHDRSVFEQLGQAPPRSPAEQAMWDSDSRHDRVAARELERVRRLAATAMVIRSGIGTGAPEVQSWQVRRGGQRYSRVW
jgi:hypothetical protein